MAVPRIEWQCPGCERRFAIRADIEPPEMCPQCRTQAGAPAENSNPDTANVQAAGAIKVDKPLADFFPEEKAPDALPRPQIHGAVPGPVRKYPALKVLAIVYKVFAVLIAVGGLVALVIAFISAVTVEDTSQRIPGILLQLGGFVGSGFAAVTLYGLGELIQLLIDIESNTRRQ